MFEPLLEELRAEVSGERALAAVADVARFHRVQASPGYDAAADWLAGELEAAGLAVEVEHVPGDGRSRRLGAVMPEGWSCARARATLIDGAAREPLCDYDRLKLSLILRSDPARGRFPLVELEDGTEDEHYRGREVRGCVVLTRGAVHRVHQLAVRERGAAGILFDGRRLLPPVRGPLDDPDAVSYTSFWWQGDEPRGWGFVVSPKTGARLRERLRGGARPELEVEIESRRFATRIPLLSATLPGAEAREALVMAHLCHPEPSANDNGSGVAAALEAARALAALFARPGARARRLGIRFLWVPELTGTHAWFAGPGADASGDGLDAGRAARTVAALNLDMVGEDQSRCGSTLLIEHPPCFAGSFAGELLRRIRDRAQDWVTSYSGPGHYSMTRMSEVPYGGGSDHAVLTDPLVGVPCPMLIQWPDRYYHSSHDTPDKCDPASLALAARCAATYAAFLSCAGAPERAWLEAAVGRGAERRRLAALDRDEPEQALAAEELRARAERASLARLDDAAPAARHDARWAGAAQSAPGRGADAVPTRAPGPLEMQRHLIAGHAALGREERERFRRFEAGAPGGPLALELAWFACDGQRTLAEIARLVTLELGAGRSCPPGTVAEFFDWTARLGRSGWRAGEVR